MGDEATSAVCGSCSRGLMSDFQNIQEVGPAEGLATEFERQVVLLRVSNLTRYIHVTMATC